MPANPRPTAGDLVTKDNLLIGMPFVEFAPVVAGVQQPFINLGIVDSFELAKELETLALESSQSGLRVTVRELVTRIDPEATIGLFNFEATVLRFILGSTSLTPVSQNPAVVVTNEEVEATQDHLDYLDLANSPVNAGSVVVTPAPNVSELVGVGDGTGGDTFGDFELANKIRLLADITGTIDVDNNGTITAYTVIAEGAAASGNEVEVRVGTSSTSGQLRFNVGGSPANVIGSITATYTPSFTLVEGLRGGSLLTVGFAFSDDGGVFTNETTDANSAAAADVTLLPATPVATVDAFYIGRQDGRFDRMVFNISTAGSGYTAVWQYSAGNGTWTPLSNVTDETNAFKIAGTPLDVTFDVPAGWVPDTVNSEEAHWLRLLVTGVTAPAGATGTQIWVSRADDYVVDLKNGRLQLHTDPDKATGESRALIYGQSVHVDYTWEQFDHNVILPFTQTQFSGVARIRHLADVGINIIWDVPSAQILLTDDSLTFADDDFTVGTLSLKILSAGGSAPFGTMKVFSEPEAAN
jgi:hypothetical protein